MSEDTRKMDISPILPAADGVADPSAFLNEIGPPQRPLAIPAEIAEIVALDAAPARTRRRKKITTLTLSSYTCRWPIGDPVQPDFHYCGEPPLNGRNYCERHDAMSMQPTSRRRSSPPA